MKYAHRTITVVATVDDVKLVFEDRLTARHRRHWGMASLEELSTAVEYATSLGIADADTICVILEHRPKVAQAADDVPGVREGRLPGGAREPRPLGLAAAAMRVGADRAGAAAQGRPLKTFDEFDFGQQPSINRPLVLESAKGQYIDAWEGGGRTALRRPEHCL